MEIGFFLKKWISFFIEPYGMIVALFSIWLVLKYFKKVKLSKISLSLALGFLFLFSYPATSNLLVTSLEDKYPKFDYKNNAQYIHVLGSGPYHDTSRPLSSMFGGVGLTRVIEGIIIHNRIENSKLIFTGYAGDSDLSNAMMNKMLAIALGVKEENIIIGENPRDTREEALFAKNIVNDKPLILVTSATHMPRSMMLFQSVGINSLAAPTDFNGGKNVSLLRLPSARYFYKSQKVMHEYWGILWSKIRG